MKETVKLPEGYEAEKKDGLIVLEGNNKKVEKQFKHALVDVEVNENEVKFSTESEKKEPQSVVSTFRSHLNNMIDGLEKGHRYEMKGVYAHFPMTIEKDKGKIQIENFMGERNPREVEIMDGVDVQIDGEDLVLTGPNKDHVAQTAARIEQTCKKGNKDPRVFQDGIYITESGFDE